MVYKSIQDKFVGPKGVWIRGVPLYRVHVDLVVAPSSAEIMIVTLFFSFSQEFWCVVMGDNDPGPHPLSWSGEQRVTGTDRGTWTETEPSQTMPLYHVSIL